MYSESTKGLRCIVEVSCWVLKLLAKGYQKPSVIFFDSVDSNVCMASIVVHRSLRIIFQLK